MGEFNFTKDLLAGTKTQKERDELADRLVEVKKLVEQDPTGLIHTQAHKELGRMKKMAARYAGRDDLPVGWDLDDWDYRVVNKIEQDFWAKTGEFPTIERLIFNNPELGKKRKRLEELYNKDAFYKILAKRGIEPPVYQEDGEGPRALSPQQLMAANFMLNLHDTRTEREKLKELGISSHKWNTWLQDPVFADYLRARSENLYGAHDHAAYTALIRAVENGDFQAVKFFFEMRGIYNPKMEVQVNVNHIMTRVVEVITRHVKDPGTLEIMAAELAQIEQG